MAKTQGDAVAEVMCANSGYATLGYLYQSVLKISQVKWGTKTPHESIRRILQKDVQRRFFKIKPGLWALEAYRNKIPFLQEASENAPEPQQEKGSGSITNDSSAFEVVAVEKKMQTGQVHFVGLRKRQRLTDETR